MDVVGAVSSGADGAAGAAPATAAPRIGRSTVGAFDAFFEEQSPRLGRVALLIVGSASVAEEVVQEAFIRVYRRWGSLDEPAAYARVCVVNGCRDRLRRRARWRQREPLLAAEPGTVDPPADPDDELVAIVRSLPERQRAAIVLRYYEDLSPTEIAEALDLSPGAVKSLLHRALGSIREEVAR